ncbi:MAG TPA: outer membrane protein assembly factor BamB [Steroidobacteraceae bacterium]|nr:outer membrane protein assembly factor BamB [Steroidobacteraceae bacterium]HRX88083.1 outer membrane protein assembly factor BamB [Steroidobacteraceae bacterium]
MNKLTALAALMLLAACSKEKPVDLPSELVDFGQSAKVTRLWSASVGGSDEVLRLGLGIAVQGERLYAAGHSGEVAAFELATGRSVWRTRTKADLAGATGANADLVVVGSSEGEVIALAAADGAIRWRTKVRGEILAAPAVGAETVVVRTVDGRLRGLSASDGAQIWETEEQVPRLSLRGTAPPTLARDLVIAGFDNGKVLAVGLADGDTIWETPVSAPTGRTELERLVDIDAAAKVADDDVFVAGFQGRAAMLALDSGQIWWTRDVSSYRGVDIDDNAMYVAAANGELLALQRRTGVELWRQDMLKFRRLSAPVVVGEFVAVADLDGYMHWFDRATGAPAARIGGIGGRVSTPPVAVDGVVYVISDNGRISALRATRNAAAN